jgi:site-specific DNA recombinase
MEAINQFHRWRRTSKATTLPSAVKTAVIYTRVSSKEQAEKNLSLDFQKRSIEEYAHRNSFTVSGYFGGTYESAKTDGRKEFKRMLDFIKANKGRVSHILVYTLDRFSRTGGAAIKLAADLREKYGVSVFAVTQPTDTSNANGVFQQNIQLLFSEFDNQLRKQRAMAGMKEKFEQGIWCVRVPPGYSIVKENGQRKIVVNDIGKKLRKAFQWKAEGIKNDEILERLKAMGWTIYPQKLSRAFSNPFYCGVIANRMLNGRLVEGTHEKLISPELFLQVNHVRSEAKGKYGVSHDKEIEPIPLKLFLKCPKCGSGYTGYVVKKKKIWYYKCRTTGCCANKNAAKVNERFIEYLSTYSVQPEFIPAMLDELKETFNSLMKGQIELEASLKARLQEVQQDIDTLEKKFYVKEQISEETFNKFYPGYVEEREKVMKLLPKSSSTISNLQDHLEKAVTFSSKLAVVWASSGFSKKERLQKMVFPEGLTYDAQKDELRTTRVNFVFAEIAYQSSKYDDPTKTKGDDKSPFVHNAEREGFEPPDLLQSTVFKTAALNRSAISPAQK